MRQMYEHPTYATWSDYLLYERLQDLLLRYWSVRKQLTTRLRRRREIQALIRAGERLTPYWLSSSNLTGIRKKVRRLRVLREQLTRMSLAAQKRDLVEWETWRHPIPPISMMPLIRRQDWNKQKPPGSQPLPA